MLVSRGALLGRVIANGLRIKAAKVPSQQIVRNAHFWSYRTSCAPHPKTVTIGAELVGAFMWWWVLWHLFHEYQHITGEFDYPDPALWTNAELGIPTDDSE